IGKILPRVFLALFTFGWCWGCYRCSHDFGRSVLSGIRCGRCLYHYIAKEPWKERISSVARGSCTGHAGPGGPVEVQDAGDELADGDSQVAPKPALQTGVILRAAKEIAHKLPEYRPAAHELHHARGDRAAQEGAAIEPPHDARRELQFGAEGSLYPSRVLFRAAFRE